MFTGIIETIGTVEETISDGGNTTYWIRSSLAGELTINQSLSHNGVCLTIEQIRHNMHRVTAVAETLSKTNLADWQTGTLINLERCLLLNGRLDGHLVQGHVDCTAKCTAIIAKEGSLEYSFNFPAEFTRLVIEKGSIAINGISLTLFNLKANGFSVTIIPYTFDHTNMSRLQINDSVNIEFDIIGKYILK